MRILLKQKDGNTKEFQFEKGPISIGRGANSNIFLPDRAVSRQHAVIQYTEDGKWTIEDLDSTSKTYLNDEAIHKAEIKHGDCLRITDFIIDFVIEEEISEEDKAMQLDDTLHLEAALAVPPHETVVRKPDAGHAPAMRLAARRLVDFAQAAEKICCAGSLDEILLCLLDITIEQLEAAHVWAALRTQPSGSMVCHAGKKRNGSPIDLGQLKLQQKIGQVVEKGQFLVLPRVSAQLEEDEAIRSALIAAVMRPNGCYGVLYADNGMKDKHYSLSDLDYLMLISMHTAAVIKKFC
ncbi:MAG: FHA domain-containing protein [Sedimentisphaerales bacterium]|nr:FHA domain-containing protein [Sedimentisphaerales bacterium]